MKGDKTICAHVWNARTQNPLTKRYMDYTGFSWSQQAMGDYLHGHHDTTPQME
jgi:hypothetical protein